MRNLSIPSVIVAVILSAVVTYFMMNGKQPTETLLHETAYQRVIRTGLLHCAYSQWDTAIMRDSDTGQFSGIIYDVMQEVGKSIGVDVVYDLEVPWDATSTVLKAGKADAHCAGIWATPGRGRLLAFSDPMFFSPTVAFARIDDRRFDYNLDNINTPNVTVALSDDDASTEIYRAQFYSAKQLTVGLDTTGEEALTALTDSKADVTFSTPSRLRNFEKKTPGKVKIVPTAKPLRIYPDTIAVDIGEDQLLHVLNTAIDQMIDSGEMDRIIAKYRDDYDTSFIVPVQRPYNWQSMSQ